MSDQQSKKRRADVELDQDNWERTDVAATEEGGPMPQADAETLAQRKRVKVVRDPATGTAVQKTANPFSGVSIMSTQAPPAKVVPTDGGKASTDAPEEPKAADGVPPGDADGGASKGDSESPESGAAATEAQGTKPSGGFGALAAGSSAAGFKFGGTSFGASFGSSASGSLFGGFGTLNGGSLFGGKTADNAGGTASSSAAAAPQEFTFSKPFAGAFGGAAAAAAAGQADVGSSSQAPSGSAASGTVPLFGSAGTQAAKESADGSILGNERPATGEEEESTIFTNDAVLFAFDAASKQWKERGKGVLRINVMPDGKCRLIMRQKGILRVLLNASLYPEMTLKLMEGGKGVSFMCLNAAKDGALDAEVDNSGKEAACQDKADTDKSAPKQEEPSSKDPASAMVMHAVRMRPPDALHAFIQLVDQHKAASGDKEGSRSKAELPV